MNTLGFSTVFRFVVIASFAAVLAACAGPKDAAPTAHPALTTAPPINPANQIPDAGPSRPSAAGADPVPRALTSRIFEGVGIFTSEDGKQASRTLKLTVSFEVDHFTRLAKAKVKFVVDGSHVGANFIDSTFDSRSGDLVAKEILILGALAGQLQLICAGVQFESPHYDFVCHYESSVTNVVGEFHLQAARP